MTALTEAEELRLRRWPTRFVKSILTSMIRAAIAALWIAFALVLIGACVRWQRAGKRGGCLWCGAKSENGHAAACPVVAGREW